MRLSFNPLTTYIKMTPSQKKEIEKMKKLTLGSFTREGSQGSFGHRFFTKLDDGREVDLESCLSGYCVGIYDKDLNLIGEKTCTKIEGMLEAQIMPGFSIGMGEALEKAVNIANEKLTPTPKQKYEREKM